jgi:long-chain fatty acid transport protein
MQFTRQTLAAAIGAALSGLAANAWATNGDQMIGVTATQWGMAGAVTAAPQDAATVMYNPAGAAELGIEEVRLDMGFGLLNPPRTANGVESDSNWYLMPAGAVAFNVDNRLYFAMSMGGLSGMGVDFSDVMPAAGNQAVVTTKQFYKIAPGFGYKINDQWTVGAALNIDYQSLALYNAQYALPQNQTYGYGFSLGAIMHVNDRVQIGLSWISQQHMNRFEWNTAGAPTSSGKIEAKMDAPMQYAIGVAFRPGSGWLIEADVKQIKFSDVLDTLYFDRPAGYTGTVPASVRFGWSDQTVFALGVQKELSPATTVRFGYNYGESPIGPEDVDNNIGSLAVVEHHLALGVTRQLGKRVAGSLSYVRAFPNEVVSSSGSGNVIELEQNIINFQLSYKN